MMKTIPCDRFLQCKYCEDSFSTGEWKSRYTYFHSDFVTYIGSTFIRCLFHHFVTHRQSGEYAKGNISPDLV